MKKFSVGKRIKDGVKALKKVKSLLLQALDLPGILASLFCSMKLVKRLTKGFCQVVQDLEAITIV